MSLFTNQLFCITSCSHLANPMLVLQETKLTRSGGLATMFWKISSAQRSDPHHHDVCLHSHTGPPGTDSGHLKLNHGKRQSYIAQKEKVRQEKTLSPICNEVCGTVDCTGPFWQSDADLAAP